MANTYTTKLGLAKPAHGDVDWHIPINENWDKIDTELDKALKISGTTIDADKNWNGKSITNVNQFSANYADVQFTVIPSDDLLIQKPLGSPFTVRNKLTGVGYVKAVISAPEHYGNGDHPRVMTVTKNGVEIWTRSQSREQTWLLKPYTETIESISVVANDVLTLSGTTDTGGATIAIYGSAYVPITSVFT